MRELCDTVTGAGAAIQRQESPSNVVIIRDVMDELDRAAKHGEFASAHEGFAVILEEMDELKEHVWTNQKHRDIPAMRAEAIQVAAMAIKFVRMLDLGVRR